MSGTSQTSIHSFEESKPTLADALKKYLMIKSASFRSEATLKQYESINGAFVRALGAEQPVEEIDELDAIEYVHSLRTREFRYINTDHKPTQEGGLTYESIRTHLNVIKIFTRWIARKYAVGDWLEDVEIPPVRQSEPKAISSSDFKRLVDATEKSLCPQRDMAILFILLDGMVRRKALVNMKIRNLDLIRNRAKVIEKGHKLHTVRWSHYTSQVIRAWMHVRPEYVDISDPRPSKDQPVFISLNDGADLEPGALNQLLNRLKRRAKVRGRANPHSFRHRGAIAYLLAGGDLASLQRRLGHNDANTTNMYAIFSEEELQRLQNDKSPLIEILELNRE